MRDTNSVFLREAMRYAELGYRVFPCAPGGKAPVTEHGFNDASTDIAQIEQWWTRHPKANIGLATAGLLVIDIDGEGNSWPNQPDRMLDLAHAPMALTPRGGNHRLFRQPPGKGWRCTESRVAPKVDTRADGGYIVVPPSVVDAKPYRWAPGLELDEARDRLPEPPLWLVEELDRLATGLPTLAHVGSILSEANPIPEGQRNATLARLAGTMRRVGMSRAEILAGLRQANQDRCQPRLPLREVERIAESVGGYEPDQIAVALAENHWDQMFAATAADDDSETPDPGPIPEHLLNVPGFIDEVMRYTLDTAPYPEPVLAFAGALTLQALLAGRKVRDPMDNRTNLYVLGLANSGVGKDHARKVNAKILYEVGLAECLGNAFASGEGIEDRLFVQPAALYQVDEVDGLLLRVSQAKDARHEQIVSILLQMYSSASGVYVMRAKAGKERTVVDQPCLCLFGTAVPKQFYAALSQRLMTNGFLARMIVLECQKRGTGREDGDCPLPSTVIAAARWWAEFLPGARPGNLSDWHPQPRLVSQTDEARVLFRGLRERADSEYSAAESRNDTIAMAIWARAYEKARRLALIYACSECHDNPVIEPGAVHWAGEFVEHQTRRMLFMSSRHAVESEFDSKRKRLLEVLTRWQEQHGDEWMPFWQINRRLPWTSREHEEVRETLFTQRLLEYQVMQTRGRPGAMYRLLPANANAHESPSEPTTS